MPAGCSTFEGDGVNVVGDLVLFGDGSDSTELDLQFSVHLLEPQPGSHITLRNLVLNHSIILTEEPLIPAFVDLHHPNTSLLLVGVHLIVQCPVLEQVRLALASLQSQNVGLHATAHT
jgi:hypothetical protein